MSFAKETKTEILQDLLSFEIAHQFPLLLLDLLLPYVGQYLVSYEGDKIKTLTNLSSLKKVKQI